jgi:hypothetical protein
VRASSWLPDAGEETGQDKSAVAFGGDRGEQPRGVVLGKGSEWGAGAIAVAVGVVRRGLPWAPAPSGSL